MRYVLAVAVGLAAAGPAMGQVVTDGSGDAKQLVPILQDVLVDPASAQISRIHAAAGGVSCGKINFKNRLGGYVGTKDFAFSVEKGTAYISPLPVDPSFAIRTDEDLAQAKRELEALNVLVKYCGLK